MNIFSIQIIIIKYYFIFVELKIFLFFSKIINLHTKGIIDLILINTFQSSLNQIES